MSILSSCVDGQRERANLYEKLTRYCGDIPRAVFLPATAENHIVYFAMMAAEAPAKGIYVFRARGCFRQEMEAKVRPGDNEPLDGWVRNTKTRNDRLTQ